MIDLLMSVKRSSIQLISHFSTILSVLQEFCNQQRNLRSVSEKENLSLVASQVPSLWNSLSDIIHFENASQYLPADVSSIVKKLVNMRINLIEQSPQRTQTDYVLWPDRDKEHCSQFYPVWDLWRYPKKYQMTSTGVDEDLCQKSFNSSKSFTNGVFRFVF